jgi:hypothetical protein
MARYVRKLGLDQRPRWPEKRRDTFHPRLDLGPRQLSQFQPERDAYQQLSGSEYIVLVKISKTAAAAISLAAALAGALPASAATIFAAATISPALTATLTSGGTQTLDFTPFDTALGTLTSVIVTESIDAGGSISFGGTSVTGVVLAAEGGSLTISEPGILANIMNETLSVSGACAATPPGSCNGT